MQQIQVAAGKARSPQPKVCIVVLNWNRPVDTLECLDSLLPIVRADQAAIVVCDNASTDDSVARIRDWAAVHFNESEKKDYPAIEDVSQDLDWRFLLARNRANHGYAGGNNTGLRIALRQGRFAFIWVLNNDTVVEADSLPELLDCAHNHPDTAVFGSTIVDYHERTKVQCAGGCRYHPLTTIMKPSHQGGSLQELLKAASVVRLDYISGAAFFIRAETLESVGLFDEVFFLYYEELDLCNRVRRSGRKIDWCRSSIVYHKGAVSTGGRSKLNRNESWQSAYHETLSTLIYTRKHHLWVLPVAACFRLAGKALTYLVRRRLYLFSPLLSAYRRFVISLFQASQPRSSDCDIEYMGLNRPNSRSVTDRR